MSRIFFSHLLISIFYTHTDRTDRTDLVRGEGAHGFWTLEFSEHEIRRRPTDRREVITEFNELMSFCQRHA